MASLAVAAAMFQTPNYDDVNHATGSSKKDTPTRKEPFHYTLACRWVGQALDPFPPQGVMADGAEDADTALREWKVSRGESHANPHNPIPSAEEIDAHLDELLAKSAKTWKPLEGDAE